MPTKFAFEKLVVLMSDGKEFIFWFDGNGKITGDDGFFENPAVNSFSLVQVQDCPFATPTCKRVCYVQGLEKAQQKIHNKYRHNSREIRKILPNSAHRETLVLVFANWISAHNLNGFRWHVSGDIFSLQYARFIRNVCDLAPETAFWLYSRSFRYLKPLAGSSNLIVNLSADKDNWAEALKIHRKFGFRLCYLTVEGEVPSELPDGSVIFPSYELRGRSLLKPTEVQWWQSLEKHYRRMVCPADFFGQSEHRRCGPCKKCLVHFS